MLISSGTRDNSGVQFSYTSTPREYDAGILELGHHVTNFMIIPPNRANYTVAGVCASDCTNKVRIRKLNCVVYFSGRIAINR